MQMTDPAPNDIPLTERRGHLLIGAALLLGDLAIDTTIANAQSALPAVTMEAPDAEAQAGAGCARIRAASAGRPVRRRTAEPPPASPTPTQRAAAEAAARTQAKLGYRAEPSATTLRSDASPLNTSQAVNVVPSQVLSDQRPRNLDDALVNISGITQANTLGSSMDAVMKRRFGDNHDGSIMRNGMPVVQGRPSNMAVDSVEVLKARPRCSTASWIPAASSTPSASGRSSPSAARSPYSARPMAAARTAAT